MVCGWLQQFRVYIHKTHVSGVRNVQGLHAQHILRHAVLEVAKVSVLHTQHILKHVVSPPIDIVYDRHVGNFD